jgi:type I restriction enzyme S subunit
MSWEEKMLSELSETPLRNGIYKEKEFQGRGQKIINMKELFAYNFIGNQEMKRVDLSDSEKERFLVQEGDLIFARRSLVDDGAGKTSIIKNLLEETTFESSMIRVRLNLQKTNPLFYFYYFTSYEGRGQVMSLSTGVNVKGIKGSELNNLVIPYPPLQTQKRIASILSTYDDLIENNLKRIKLLEETAQNIYKEWFVNFRFPNYENTPINQESGLPEGWEVKKIEESIKVLKGKKPNNEFSSNGENRILYLLVDVLERKELRYTDNENIQLTKEGETLMLMDGSRSGLVFKSLDGAIGSTLAVFRIKNNDFGINYCFNYFKFRESEIISKNTGSAIPHANKSYIYGMDIAIPSNKINSEFEKITSRIYNQIEVLQTKNQKLKEARDILLPRLMNRTIEV